MTTASISINLTGDDEVRTDKHGGVWLSSVGLGSIVIYSDDPAALRHLGGALLDRAEALDAARDEVTR